jgi:hypothetical protein
MRPASSIEIGHVGTAHMQLLQAIGADSHQERPLLCMQHVPDVR